jgi:hypothetical protein
MRVGVAEACKIGEPIGDNVGGGQYRMIVAAAHFDRGMRTALISCRQR